MWRMSIAFGRHGPEWCVICWCARTIVDVLVVQSSDDSSPLQRQASFNWNFSKSGQSPTKSNIVESPSPHPSPQRLEHDRGNGPPSATLSPSPSQMLHSSGEGNITPKPFGPSPGGSSSQLPVTNGSKPQPRRQESSDNLKSFKVSLEDPAWKVLPAALKKYKINNDDWQNYAMFICYGSAGQYFFSLICAVSNLHGQEVVSKGA